MMQNAMFPTLRGKTDTCVKEDGIKKQKPLRDIAVVFA